MLQIFDRLALEDVTGPTDSVKLPFEKDGTSRTKKTKKFSIRVGKTVPASVKKDEWHKQDTSAVKERWVRCTRYRSFGAGPSFTINHRL